MCRQNRGEVCSRVWNDSELYDVVIEHNGSQVVFGKRPQAATHLSPLADGKLTTFREYISVIFRKHLSLILFDPCYLLLFYNVLLPRFATHQ